VRSGLFTLAKFGVAALLSVSVHVGPAFALSFIQQAADTDTDAGAAKFAAWKQQIRQEALAKGISSATLDAVMPTIKQPVKKVVKRDRNQPEVVQSYAGYLTRRLSDWRISKGREQFWGSQDTLQAAAARFQVQPRFITAIWGIETNYGTIPLTLSVFDAVTTLAYDGRRAKRFRQELFAALEIVDKGYASLDMMKGSWAGALGQPQFMPDSYLRYAVDQDGDGKRNIWTSKADVHASIANYLSTFGWRNDQTWGRMVNLPKDGETTLVGKQSEGLKAPGSCGRYKSIGIWRDLQEWQDLGVRRTDGSDLPARANLPTALIVGDKGDNQGYLVYQNFCTIMRYNPSFKYALAVGMLSDLVKQRPQVEASR